MSRHYVVDREAKRLTFNDLRFYMHPESGDWFPSATTILDCYPKGLQFLQWLKDNGDHADVIRDLAADNGSLVHHLTERYDLGEEVTCVTENGNISYPATVWKMFERYVQFTEKFQPEILEIEKNMVSPKLGFGGSLDRKYLLGEAFGKYAGKKYLVDIKTSNMLHNSYWLQTAAYVKLYEEVTGEKVDGVAVLWLNAKTRTDGKNGAIQGVGWQMVFPDKEIEYYWKLFRCVHALFLEEYGDMKPKHLSYQLSHKRTIKTT